GHLINDLHVDVGDLAWAKPTVVAARVHRRTSPRIVTGARLTDNQRMPDRTEAFPAEALAENRSGRLTDDQALRFQRLVSSRRTSTRGLAMPVGAIGALLLILNGPASTAVKRHLAGWGFVTAAVMILAAPAFARRQLDLPHALTRPFCYRRGAVAS